MLVAMLELEVIPEHGLTSDQIEFLLGKSYQGSGNCCFFQCQSTNDFIDFNCFIRISLDNRITACEKYFWNSADIDRLDLLMFCVNEEANHRD